MFWFCYNLLLLFNLCLKERKIKKYAACFCNVKSCSTSHKQPQVLFLITFSTNNISSAIADDRAHSAALEELFHALVIKIMNFSCLLYALLARSESWKMFMYDINLIVTSHFFPGLFTDIFMHEKIGKYSLREINLHERNFLNRN